MGQASEGLDLAEGTTVQTLMDQIADRAGSEIRSFLFGESGKLSGSVLLFLNDEQVLWSEPTELREGDRLTIATPIAGGVSFTRPMDGPFLFPGSPGGLPSLRLPRQWMIPMPIAWPRETP